MRGFLIGLMASLFAAACGQERAVGPSGATPVPTATQPAEAAVERPSGTGIVDGEVLDDIEAAEAGQAEAEAEWVVEPGTFFTPRLNVEDDGAFFQLRAELGADRTIRTGREAIISIQCIDLAVGRSVRVTSPHLAQFMSERSTVQLYSSGDEGAALSGLWTIGVTRGVPEAKMVEFSAKSLPARARAHFNRRKRH